MTSRVKQSKFYMCVSSFHFQRYLNVVKVKKNIFFYLRVDKNVPHIDWT